MSWHCKKAKSCCSQPPLLRCAVKPSVVLTLQDLGLHNQSAADPVSSSCSLLLQWIVAPAPIKPRKTSATSASLRKCTCVMNVRCRATSKRNFHSTSREHMKTHCKHITSLAMHTMSTCPQKQTKPQPATHLWLCMHCNQMHFHVMRRNGDFLHI